MKPTLLLSIFLLVGCRSVDWNQRVGVYSYNQAMTDYGPPDKSIELVNGATLHGWELYHRVPPWMDEIILGFDRNDRLVSGMQKRYHGRVPGSLPSTKARDDSSAAQLQELNRKVGDLSSELNRLRWNMEAEKLRKLSD